MNLRKVKVKSIWNSQSSLYFFQGQPFKKKAFSNQKKGPRLDSSQIIEVMQSILLFRDAQIGSRLWESDS